MAHFAHINENNIVTEVIVIEQEMLNTGLWGDPKEWVQTSYNTYGGVHYGPDGKPDGGMPLRKNYAGIGSVYDPVRDAFYVPKPYPSWILDEETCYWNPPVPCPGVLDDYHWNESSQAWDPIT